VAVFAEREAVRHGGVLAEQFAESRHVHLNLVERGAILERNHQIENSR
jgi:hypothetical protein